MTLQSKIQSNNQPIENSAIMHKLLARAHTHLHAQTRARDLSVAHGVNQQFALCCPCRHQLLSAIATLSSSDVRHRRDNELGNVGVVPKRILATNGRNWVRAAALPMSR